MRALITALETDQWNSPEVQACKRLKDEFSVHNGLVSRRNRIVISATLRNKAVDLAHLGHQGIVKTKQLIRDKVWFPGIHKMTEETIQNCLPCQAATAKSPPPEPLCMTKLPSALWKEGAVDFCRTIPKLRLHNVGYRRIQLLSRSGITDSTSAKAVIPKVDPIFARQGVPDIVTTAHPSMDMNLRTLLIS